MTRDALSIQEIQCDMSFNQIFSVKQKIETHAIILFYTIQNVFSLK